MGKDNEGLIKFPGEYPKPRLLEPISIAPRAESTPQVLPEGVVSFVERRRRRLVSYRLRHLCEAIAVGFVGSGADQMIAKYLSNGHQSHNDQIFGPLILGGITIAGFLSAMNKR